MEDSVVGVIEFGATARGDDDDYSDRDIFVLVEDADGDMLRALASRVATEYGTSDPSVACYSVSSFDLMIERGSLFTWHLKLEGRVLHDPDRIFDEAFDHLAPYTSFLSDLARFRHVFDDVVSSNIRRELDTFDAHILYIVVRNVCMLLTAWVWPPAFGRRTVVRAARELHPSLPLSQAVADWLEIRHLAYTRNMCIGKVTSPSASARDIVEEVEMLLAHAAAIFNRRRE